MSDIMTAITLYNLADDTFNLKLKENVVLFDRDEEGGAFNDCKYLPILLVYKKSAI